REQRTKAVFDAKGALAVFAFKTGLDFAAQELGQKLQSIADPQEGNSAFKEGRVRQRRVLRVNAGRAAGKNNALRRERGQFADGGIVAQNLRIDIAFADAPRDDLRVLRAKI